MSDPREKRTVENLRAAIAAVEEARHLVKLALDEQPDDDDEAALTKHLRIAYGNVDDCWEVLTRAWTLDEVYPLVKRFGSESQAAYE